VYGTEILEYDRLLQDPSLSPEERQNIEANKQVAESQKSMFEQKLQVVTGQSNTTP